MLSRLATRSLASKGSRSFSVLAKLKEGLNPVGVDPNVRLQKQSKSTIDEFNLHAGLDNSLNHYPAAKETVLPNGIRVVTEKSGTGSATVGVFMATGSRYEDDIATNGVAHFVEHMLFKGTPRRTRYQLEVEVENCGAHLNAYTTRENTVYSMKVPKPEIGRAVDIIGDMLMNSVFHPRAIELERSTILREAESVQENLQEVVMDHLHAIAYPDQAIGRTILGTDEHIQTLSKQMMHDYVRNHFVGERMFLVGAGDVDHDELVAYANKSLGGVPMTHEERRDVTKGTAVFNPTMGVIKAEDLNETYIAYAFETAGWNDVELFPLFCFQMMLGTYVGGNTAALYSRNSRIQELANLGVTVSMDPFNTIYSDTGLFGLYMVHSKADKEMIHQANEIAVRNFLLSAAECSDADLAEAKNKLKMSLLGQLDGSTATFEDIGRNILGVGYRIHPLETLKRLEAVTKDDVMALARKYFINKNPVVMAIGDVDSLQSYNWWCRPGTIEEMQEQKSTVSARQ